MSEGRTQESWIPRRPHRVAPALASIRLILTARVFLTAPGSHIGLNITAVNNQKVLQRHGVEVEVWPTQSVKELRERLVVDWRKHGRAGRPITHVIISAPGWIHPLHLSELAQVWPNIQFTVLNHSDIPYFCIDRFGTRNNRMLLDLFLHTHNIAVAANNQRVVRALSETFGRQVSLLTNLYDCQSFVELSSHRRDYDPLRVGSFGAGRPWKNQLAAAYAAVPLARRLRVFLEYYVNSRRPDGGERMIESRGELFQDLPGARLLEVPWSPWPRFRSVVRSMDVLISPSFSETFCVVAADGIAEGTPSVVGPAMEWTPRSWQCEPHDPESIMLTAMGLLADPHAVDDGRRYLREYVHNGIDRWIRYLTGQPEVRI